MQINIYEAKAKLSALIERAVAGEEVVIARAGKALVRLQPITPLNEPGVRLGGLREAGLIVSPDFHAPLDDEDLLGR